jgi:site-specific DNA-methyltransferase (adenine-specific)
MLQVNSLYNSDIADILPEIPSDYIQAVVADPPYYNVLKEDWDTQWNQINDYLEWCDFWTSHCMRVLKEDGLFFIFGQLGKREHVFIHLMSRLCEKYQFHDLVIWDRVVGYNERRDSFTPSYEMILILRKSEIVKFNKDAVRIPYDEKTINLYLRDKRYKDKQARIEHLEKGRYSTNIISIPSLKGASKEKCGHPSQKPLELISKLIMCSTDVEDIVLDPFLGSGTTAVAAEMLGRKWIGIEKDKDYCSICENRLKEIDGFIEKEPDGKFTRISHQKTTGIFPLINY